MGWHLFGAVHTNHAPDHLDGAVKTSVASLHSPGQPARAAFPWFVEPASRAAPLMCS